MEGEGERDSRKEGIKKGRMREIQRQEGREEEMKEYSRRERTSEGKGRKGEKEIEGKEGR